MDKLEKVIKALECMTSSGNAGMRDDCKNCIYTGCGDCLAPMLKDALALLKAQEPRVMTLEEAMGGEECWVEYPNGGCGYADCYLSYTTNGADIYRTMQHDFNVPLANYGKTWRCWTSRPTDAQREAVPWQG